MPARRTPGTPTGTRTPGHTRPALPSWAGVGFPGEDLSWQDEGLCKRNDPDLFFPEKGSAGKAAAVTAKRVCAACPVRTACLAYALAHNEQHGVWGGTTRTERRALTRHTRREVHDAEIARFTHAGLTTRQIAERLAISPRTVHRARARLRTEQVAATPGTGSEAA